MKKTLFMLLSALLIFTFTMMTGAVSLDSAEGAAAVLMADSDPTLVFEENFDGLSLGTKVDINTSLNISNVGTNWLPLADNFKFHMGDYTTTINVATDPDSSRSGNSLFVTNTSIKMVEIEKTRKNYDLGLNKTGKYSFKAKVYFPNDSGLSSLRVTVVTDTSDNNGVTMATPSGKGEWKDVSFDILVGPNQSYSEIKAIKFWNWPDADGGVYLDDVSLHFYDSEVLFYTDESVSSKVASTYSVSGAAVDFPAASLYREYLPEGKMITGFNIGGKFYSYSDTYTANEDDIYDGVIMAIPVFEDVPESTYGDLVFFDDFESWKVGYSENSNNGTYKSVAYIAPEYDASAENNDFAVTYGNSGVNVVYSEELESKVLKLTDSTFPLVYVRRNTTYTWGDMGAFNNKINKPGIYTITADFLVPEGQTVHNVRIWAYNNIATASTTDNPGEMNYTAFSVTPKAGNKVTLVAKVVLPDGDITDITRLAFLAQCSSGADYLYLDNIAMYYSEVEAPVNIDYNEIRFGSNAGLRFTSFLSFAAKNNAEEYGYIVARADHLEVAGVNGDALKFGTATGNNQSGTVALGDKNIPYVSGMNYKKENGEVLVDKVFTEDGERYGSKSEGEGIYFTSVLTGMTEAEHYKAQLTVRPYMIVDGTVYYGNATTASFYDVMDKIYTENKDMLSDTQLEYIEGIYELCK